VVVTAETTPEELWQVAAKAAEKASTKKEKVDESNT
jgi:hypothetical protein